jgi:hypothetical protein
MSAPAYRYKTHTSTGSMWWASVHYLRRCIASTTRYPTREQAAEAARVQIRERMAAQRVAAVAAKGGGA